MSDVLQHVIYAIFRVGERLGAPLTAASRTGGPRGDPRSELRSQAYDVAHAARCWRARRMRLAPGAVDRVGAELTATERLGPADSLDAVLPEGWTDGNAVRLLARNSEDQARRLALIAGASRSIVCAFWCIRDAAVGHAFVAALAARVRDGVDVVVVLDANVLDRFAWIEQSYGAFVTSFAAQGVPLVALRPAQPWLNTHRKLFAVDGEVAIVGGRNIGVPYATDGEGTFLDTDLEISGPGALAVHHLVDRLAGRPLTELPMPPAAGPARVAVVDQPAGLDPVDDAVVRALVQAVVHARASVEIAFGYVILPGALERALVQAAARGVAVRVLTNSRATNDYPYWEGAAFASIDALVRAGVPLFLMRERTLHAKFAVVDGRVCTVGSHNLWTLSTLHDAETNLVVDDPEIAEALVALFDELVGQADRVEPDGWQVPDNRSLRLANALIWAWEGRG
jgi:cardiolipin synthase